MVLRREMGISHADFLRVFPEVIGGQAFDVNGRRVTVRQPGRQLTIELSLEQTRRLGELSLPVTHVRFEFSGYAGAEIRHFMGRFDRLFHRGGG